MLGRREWRLHRRHRAARGLATPRRVRLGAAARDLAEARNLAFPILVFGELFRAFAARSTTRLFWEVGAFTNLRLLGVVVVSVLLQLGIHHLPAAQEVFETGRCRAARGRSSWRSRSRR